MSMVDAAPDANAVQPDDSVLWLLTVTRADQRRQEAA
jgi:hypothetical protein